MNLEQSPQDLVLPGLVILSVLACMVITWLLGRAPLLGELRQFVERVRIGEEYCGALQARFDELKREAGDTQEAFANARAELATVTERASRVPSLESELALSLADLGRLSGELTEQRTRLEAQHDTEDQKLALLLNAKEALTDQFKSLVGDILEEKSKRLPSRTR